MPVAAKEQGLMQRTVVIEFPSVGAAQKAYDSAAYKEALAALGNGAERESASSRAWSRSFHPPLAGG